MLWIYWGIYESVKIPKEGLVHAMDNIWISQLVARPHMEFTILWMYWELSQCEITKQGVVHSMELLG